MKRTCMMLTAFCGIFIVNAMPTAEEIAAVEPLVQEVMKAEMDALRSGKKTREQVGDAAVALAKQAQTPAEKYIIFTGAFEQYARGGAYEKANTALVALRTAIPDWKQSEELALIEKTLRSVAYGKGGPVRERYEVLKERQQYALRLKKAIEQAKAKPSDKQLQFQVATYSAMLDRWPQAIDAFIAGSNQACADAAKLEKDAASPAKIADAWWTASNLKPDFLSSTLRAHAVEFYKKALADPSFVGLQRIAAERRIQETQSVAESACDSSPKSNTSSFASSVGIAKYYGVSLVGGTVKENNGIISGFSAGSYAKINEPFNPGKHEIEAVICFTTAKTVSTAGLMGGAGSKCGFTPFYITDTKFTGCISTNGDSWNVAFAVPIGVDIKPETTYRIKCTWDGKVYSWYVWNQKWQLKKSIRCANPVFGGLNLQLGTNRGQNCPFPGGIDLNKSYICINGKLWWEGVRGAYKLANK